MKLVIVFSKKLKFVVENKIHSKFVDVSAIFLMSQTQGDLGDFE